MRVRPHIMACGREGNAQTTATNVRFLGAHQVQISQRSSHWSAMTPGSVFATARRRARGWGTSALHP